MVLSFYGGNMAEIHPLLNVPIDSFFRTTCNNDKTLYDLRVTSRRTEGFFVVKNDKSTDFTNTFPLMGAKMTGHWHLGKITKTPDSECDFLIEIYLKARIGNVSGIVLSCECSDKKDLVDVLRDFERGELDFSYASKWEIIHSDVFTKLGFDVV